MVPVPMRVRAAAGPWKTLPHKIEQYEYQHAEGLHATPNIQSSIQKWVNKGSSNRSHYTGEAQRQADLNLVSHHLT